MTAAAHVQIPVLPHKRMQSYPKHVDAAKVLYLPLPDGLQRRYATDSHFASYSVPELPHRLSRDVLKERAVPMVLVVFDVDGDGHAATDPWWQAERAKLADLLDEHRGGYVYRTRGGYRIVYQASTPIAIVDESDKDAWTALYESWVRYLARRFNIVADPACKDWQRLYRLPHATRDEGGQPEQLEIIGDANAIGEWHCELTADDMVEPATSTISVEQCATGTYVGRGRLVEAFANRGWLGREIESGKSIARCPWESQHSKNEEPTSTVIYDATAGNDLGHFHCSHAHCADKTQEDVLRLFTPQELRICGEQTLNHKQCAAKELYSDGKCLWHSGTKEAEAERKRQREEKDQSESRNEKTAGQKPTAFSPIDVIRRWRDEGPLVRIPTGIEPLDEKCRGGLPFPWRVMLVGAPSAGKTFIEIVIANRMVRRLAERGVTVGILGVDEEPEDDVVRLVQIAGFTVEQAEQRDPAVLAEMEKALDGLPIKLYGAEHTIESAGDDLRKAAGDGLAALFIDSIQTVRSQAAIDTGAETDRAIVAANITAVRAVATTRRLLTVATSEANRASYRSAAAAEESNDLAAGAESRAIEYGAQTQLMLRTPKDHPDVIHVRIAKNRRASVGEFWLRLDRERHSLEPCAEPASASDATAAERDERQRGAKREQVERDAKALLTIVRNRPGLGERELRGAFKAAGVGGVERLDAARDLLAVGLDGWRLADRGGGGPGKPRRWCLDPTEVADA